MTSCVVQDLLRILKPLSPRKAGMRPGLPKSKDCPRTVGRCAFERKGMDEVAHGRVSGGGSDQGRPRIATIERRTTETDIRLTLNLDGTGQADIETGIGFFDHMLTAFARHGLFDLTVRTDGDLHVDG